MNKLWFNSIIASGMLMVPAVFGAQDKLAEGFANPPNSAKPQVWWRWCNRNVSKEGITLDLEALNHLGIGGVLQSDLYYEDYPSGPVVFRSPEYWEMIRHAVAECRRLGLEFTMNDSPGWKPSGGPWVSEENKSRRLSFNRVAVQGPKQFATDLPLPHAFVENVAVLAFPTPAGALENLWGKSPKITSTVAGFDPAQLHDGNLQNGVKLPKEGSVLIELGKPATFRSATFLARGTRRLVLEASDDGVTFRTLSVLLPMSFTGHPVMPTTTMAFAPVTARWFRLRVAEGSTQLVEFDMDNAAVVHDLGARALWYTQYEMVPPPFVDGEDAVIDPAKVVDLTGQVQFGKRLVWQVPAGNWTVLRIDQCVSSGVMGPAEPVARGSQCNKLSAKAVTEHFEGGVRAVFEKLGIERGGQTFVGMHMDSWEAGEANWTAGFEVEFKQRRGYDMKPYLPALAGHVVVNSDITERFLWDFRRTLGDLIVDNHWLLYHRLCKENGLLYEIQPYGGAGSPFDELRVARHCDIVQNEVWGSGKGYDLVNGIPAAGHVYGKKIVSAEAWTGAGNLFEVDPFAIKTVGDYMLVTGVNRLMIHTAGHQPWTDPVGGVMDYAMFFHRGNTWFAHSGDFVKYLSRCQFLLQEGRFVADLVYLYGEDTPLRLNPRKPNVPYGYAWDACPAELAIAAMEVKDGEIVLPSGMRYKMLLLPPDERLTPELMRKVRELALAGATVLGRKPVGSPTLTHFPSGDNEVRKIADELWPKSAELGAERKVGKGRVINAWDMAQVNVVKRSFNFQAGSPDMEAGLEKIFAQLGGKPDFALSMQPSDSKTELLKVNYLHRSMADGSEVYFIANPNQTKDRLRLEVSFRQSGRQPQFWRPDTGERTLPEKWEEQDGRIAFTLEMDPAGSVFVVFRKPGAGAPPEPFRRWELVKPIALAGPWDVSFQKNRGAPPRATFEKLISWPEHGEFGIKYFSGTATYSQRVVIAEADAKATGLRWLLNLGDVQNLASVKVNGVRFGTLWKPPFIVDIATAIKPGANVLEIEVTNLLFNRLVGDEQLPDDLGEKKNIKGRNGLQAWPEWFLKGEPRPTKRVTLWSVVMDKHRQGPPLKPSGLLGPVTLQLEQEQKATTQ